MSLRGPTETRLTSRKRGSTGLAALIDPDNFDKKRAALVAETAEKLGFSCIFIGGSTLGDQTHLDDVVRAVKQHVTCPVILFPGNVTGISRHADAILFSSLLNSTNTYFIIGAQAIGAIQVNRYGLEAIPMGYLVFGDESTTSFIGQARPIPYAKPAVAVMYALAAQYLGMRALYLEAGSGSNHPMPAEVVKAVRKQLQRPLDRRWRHHHPEDCDHAGRGWSRPAGDWQPARDQGLSEQTAPDNQRSEGQA